MGPSWSDRRHSRSARTPNTPARPNRNDSRVGSTRRQGIVEQQFFDVAIGPGGVEGFLQHPAGFVVALLLEAIAQLSPLTADRRRLSRSQAVWSTAVRRMVSISSTRERNSTSSSAPSGRMKQTWGEKIVPHPGRSRTWRKAGLGVPARAVSIPDGKVPDTGERSTIAAETPAGPATISAPKIGRSKRGSGTRRSGESADPDRAAPVPGGSAHRGSTAAHANTISPSSCPSMGEIGWRRAVSVW